VEDVGDVGSVRSVGDVGELLLRMDGDIESV
jgi:hypothetical protein